MLPKGSLEQVGKTPRRPRRWASFSLSWMYSHGNARASSRRLGQPDTLLAAVDRQYCRRHVIYDGHRLARARAANLGLATPYDSDPLPIEFCMRASGSYPPMGPVPDRELSPQAQAREVRAREPSGPREGVYAALAFPTVNRFRVTLSYGRAGRLRAQNGGRRPAQAPTSSCTSSSSCSPSPR